MQHKRHETFVFKPSLPNHYRCRVLPLHLITLSNTYTLGKTLLEEGSALLRDLFLYNTQHLQETNIHVSWRYSNPKFQQASSRRRTP